LGCGDVGLYVARTVNMRESSIENYFNQRVKEHGGEVRKVKWIGRRGAPDRLMLAPRRHCLVELKRPTKEAEEHQAREHVRLRKAGFEVYVLATYEQVDEFIGRIFLC
jgi:hypothetical protein